MAEIGDLCEIQGELLIEWKIRHFFSLSDEKNVHYVSPVFYFSGTSWSLKIYPNSVTKREADGWIAFYINRKSSGSPINLFISVAIKKANGNKYCHVKFDAVFDGEISGIGYNKLILRSALLEQEEELTPSNELTIICSLQNNKPNPVARSLFCRLKNICENLKNIFLNGKRTDLTLKFFQSSICAHRMILETQSSVFAAMLSHNTKENQTGEVFIEDIDPFTMSTLIKYMYCGDIDKLTTDNVLSLYGAAHKYDVKYVREMCSEFITRHLSVEWVCDVIKFADLYQDEKISQSAKEYFQKNANEVMQTEKWKSLITYNNSIVIDLLSTVVKTLLRE